MSPELLTAIASVGTFVVITASAVAAIVQLRHMQGSNQILALNEFREAFESAEIVAARDALQEIPLRLKDPTVRRQLERGPLPAWIQTVMPAARLYETLGGYVKHRIVKTEIVCDLWSPVIVTAWDLLAPLIVVMRRTRGPALFENFEMLTVLCQEWNARHPSDYPKGLRRLGLADPWAHEDSEGS